MDGSVDYINEGYDGHKIKSQHIASMVYTNSYSDMAYDKFEMNPYGVIYPVCKEQIDDTNIIELVWNILKEGLLKERPIMKELPIVYKHNCSYTYTKVTKYTPLYVRCRKKSLLYKLN